MPDQPTAETLDQIQARAAREKDWDVIHQQNFHVVILKTGVTDMDAQPEDYRRVDVRAGSIGKAYESAEVVAALAEDGGYQIVRAMPPGVRTEGEINAQKRAYTASQGR